MTKRLCLLAVAALAAMVGCQKAPPRENAPHPRVVTFSPALTELAFSLGLGDHVVGVTTQDLLPPDEARPIVGDLINVNTEAVLALKPDVLMVQIDPKNFDTIRKFDPSIRVEHFTIETLAQTGEAMVRVGEILGDKPAGEKARRQFEEKLDAVRKSVAGKSRPRVLFVLWLGTPATGGRESFVHEMIETAGGTDLAGDFTRWRNLDMESILAMSPDVLVCWTMPGSESQAREKFEVLSRLGKRQPRMYFVADRFWTIPTGRTADLVGQLAEMIHPSAASQPATRKKD